VVCCGKLRLRTYPPAFGDAVKDLVDIHMLARDGPGLAADTDDWILEFLQGPFADGDTWMDAGTPLYMIYS
jgi:hypothetical protein